MRTSSLLVALILCFAGLAAHGEDIIIKGIKLPKAPPMDLLKETEALRLQTEESVQKVNPPATMFLTVLGGIVEPTFLSVESHGHTVDYAFDRQLPLLSAQFTDYLFNESWGKLGWGAALGYSYSEYQGLNATALHLLPASVAVAYRGEFTSTQRVIPYVAAGPSLWSYFQRGLDQYNTSGTAWSGSAQAGVAFNLNRMKIIDSRNDTEIVLQYVRNFGLSNSMLDFTGNAFEVGGTLAL